MNKLVIVGNGFDRAHGLPTSYCDFINQFWKEFPARWKTEEIGKMIQINDSYNGYLNGGEKSIDSYLQLTKNLADYSKDDKVYDKGECKTKSGEIIFKIKNTFLKIISDKSIENWVDIENIYYDLLTDIVTGSRKLYDGDIAKLNSEFEEIKNELEKYLKTEVVDRYRFSVDMDDNEILKIFRIHRRSLRLDIKNQIFLEFPEDCHTDLINFDTNFEQYWSSESKEDRAKVEWPQIMFLNFNYTPTIGAYVSAINNAPLTYFGKDAREIQIHGAINQKSNPINFGFGDEMDDHYKIIEKSRDNRYLENIKSFQYLYNSNYRELLNWVDSKDFQVFIFGHSCGLSDRTMLNTIFENEHCRSIKIFFYEHNKSDNFKDLTQNISRHFDDKKKMRSKIVDRSISDPLDQTVRFFEKPKKES